MVGEEEIVGVTVGNNVGLKVGLVGPLEGM